MKRALTAVALFLGLSSCSGLDVLDTLTPSGDMTAHKNISFADHERGAMDIYVPLEKGVMRPIILWLYGGSWSSGEKQGYRFIAEWLTRLGYVVAIPDYRLYPDVRYPDFLVDNAKALSWLSRADNVKPYQANSSCIIVMGHSAGAYNAAMLSYDMRWRDQVQVNGHHIKAFVGLAGPYDFYPFDGETTRNVFGHSAPAELTQPVHHVGRDDDVPALLLHGLDDETVRPANAESLAQKLWDSGAQADLHLLEGIDHREVLTALSSTLSREEIRSLVARFLKRTSERRCNGAVSLPTPEVLQGE